MSFMKWLRNYEKSDTYLGYLYYELTKGIGLEPGSETSKQIEHYILHADRARAQLIINFFRKAWVRYSRSLTALNKSEA